MDALSSHDSERLQKWIEWWALLDKRMVELGLKEDERELIALYILITYSTKSTWILKIVFKAFKRSIENLPAIPD